MTENSSIQRCDILSLNFKDLRLATSGYATKLEVSKGDARTLPLGQIIARPWLISSNQFLLSRHKIGTELLIHCRNGFHLDDPNMYRTRFHVDYHRLHDPALKSYYRKTLVKNRLKKLDLINEKDDAICSNKDFVEYLCYLDNIRAKNEANVIKSEEENRLSNDFAGIFRRNQYKHVPKLDVYSKSAKKTKVQSQMKVEDKSVERFERLKDERKAHKRESNAIKGAQSILKRQKVIQNENKRKIDMKNKMDQKLKEADRRKEIILSERNKTKLQKRYNRFERSIAVGQKKYFRNIELYEMCKDSERRNAEDRYKRLKKFREIDKIGMIKIRQQIALRTVKKEQCGMLIDKILNVLPIKIGKHYSPDPSSNNHEEISRRISLLNTSTFITRCVTTANATLQILEFPVSSSEMLFQIAGLMMTDAIIVPGIAPMACVLVTQRLTEIVFKLITEIRDEHIKRIRNERERSKTNKKIRDEHIKRIRNEREQSKTNKKVGILYIPDNYGDIDNDNERNLKSLYNKSERVMFSEASISDKSRKDEFEVKKASLQSSRSKAKMYNINEVIGIEMRHVIEFIVKGELDFSDQFKTRDFHHLNDFQNFFLSKSLENLEHLVKMKKEHDWIEFERAPWTNKRINLERLSSRIAIVMMKYNKTINEFGEITAKVSEYICIETDRKLRNDGSGDAEEEMDDYDEKDVAKTISYSSNQSYLILNDNSKQH